MVKKINNIIEKLSPEAKKKLKKSKQPDWIDPMLAVLTENYFSSKDYLYEHKWDGERIIAYKQNNKINLMTRNKIIANANYPDIAKELEKQNINNFILDGEVIAEKKNGLSDFSLLKKIMHAGGTKTEEKVKIYYYIFDIMFLDQYDLTNLELKDRKILLENSINFSGKLKFTDYQIGNGLKYFDKACKNKWEGLIAKNIHSTYKQKRSKDWLKFKCIEQQEFVIGGYTEPAGQRINFGALLLGYYENNNLIYAGKVGTGFDNKTLKKLGQKLFNIEQEKCPFKFVNISKKGVHWVKPKLVAEIKFSEWTEYNKLRHPRFMGLREDKDPKDVIKEQPVKSTNI